MYFCNYDETKVKSQVKRIEITSQYLIIITNYNNSTGVSIKIENPQIDLTKKVWYGISALNALDYMQKGQGTILVEEHLNNEGELIVSYIN